MNRLAPLCLAAMAIASGVRAADKAPPAVPRDPSGIAVRVGRHDGFGRIVFDVAANVHYRLSRDGDTVAIRFPDTTVLRAAPAPPNNVRSLRTDADKADIVLTAGAALRKMRVDGHVVIDVLDPPSGGTAAAKPARPAARAAAAAPEPLAAPLPTLASVKPIAPPTAAEPAPVQPAAEPAPAEPPPDSAAPPGPVALAAQPVAAMQGAAFTVPLGPRAGAAVFRHGATTYIVFDERRPIDLAVLRNSPAFGEAAVRQLQSGTLIALTAPPNMMVAATQTSDGWKIAVQPGPAPARPIAQTLADGQLSLAMEEPGSVISLADPVSGATLLVGTARRAGQAVVTARRTPEFAILPASQGVVVEPLSDSIALRSVPTGFLLTGGAAGLAMTRPTAATEAMAAAVHLTRRFRLPALSTAALSRQLARGIAEAAAAPPRARGPKRRAVAATMLSLGMAAEAEALLLLAASQDPKEATSPDTIGMTAIAALLAHRPDDAAGIDDPRLSGSDEISLWRAVRQAMRDETSPQAAAIFAATGPLVLLCPTAMRDRVLPLVVETMILGGEAPAAKRLLALAHDAPGLAFARALMKQADGDGAGALAALDALAAGQDRRDRARAAARAVELRLASGQLDAGQAAGALDRLRYAWRGGQWELAVRERIADLRQRGGGWRAALAELRSAEADFPDHGPAIHAHLMGMFNTMLNSEATDALAPLDLVALAEENADLFKTMPANDELQARLADRLMALDLPGRAEPLLDKLAKTSASGHGRAMFGARLATLRLHEDNPAGALAALAESAGPDLDPPLTEQRATLAAAAKARQGDTAGAIEALAALTGAAADTTRASIYEQAGDWPSAEHALQAVAAETLPPTGDLTDAHRQLLVRLATAAERAGDRAALSELRVSIGDRLGMGPLADMIRLLTAEPLRAAQDLPRADREMGLAGGVTAGLAALRGQ